MARSYRELLEAHSGRQIQKWTHYPEIYDRHLSSFRGRDVRVLEIGIAHGGSLQVWREYFGPNASIYAIDTDERCRVLGEGLAEVFIGSQDDRDFLRRVLAQCTPLDIVIDDGGHGMVQQRVAFEELFPHVRAGGVYLCEDAHTSYWPEYGGGIRRRGTFIEEMKRLIDDLHAWHSRQRGFAASRRTREVESVHFYDSVVVVERADRQAPRAVRVGVPSFEEAASGRGDGPREAPLRRWALGVVERVLRTFRLRSIRG